VCVGIFQSERQGKFLHKRFYTLAKIALKKPLENSFDDQAMSRQVSKLQTYIVYSEDISKMNQGGLQVSSPARDLM